MSRLDSPQKAFLIIFFSAVRDFGKITLEWTYSICALVLVGGGKEGGG